MVHGFFVAACGPSAVVVSRGYFQIAVHKLLLVMVSLVDLEFMGFSSCGTWAQEFRRLRSGMQA